MKDEIRQREHYDRVADAYLAARRDVSFGRRYYAYSHRRWLDEMGDHAPGRVLIAGCGGDACLWEEVERRGGQPVGLDLSPRMLGALRAARPEAAVACGDMTRLPCAESVFDTVLVYGALHHVPAYERALAELRRCLRPDGVLMLAETGGDHPLVRAGRRWFYRRSPAFDAATERDFTTRELRRGLRRAGFRHVRLWRREYLGYLLLANSDVLPVAGWSWLERGADWLIRLDECCERLPLIRACAVGLYARAVR